MAFKDIAIRTTRALGLGLALFLIFGTELRNAGVVWQEAIAVALAVAFPLLFFPYSRSVWMAMEFPSST